jgi:molecular chaperone DnaK (HSP70)
MRPRPTLIIDFGNSTAAALVVTDQGCWPVLDPIGGAARWPCALHWDGERMVAGAAAQQRAQADPAGYTGYLRRALTFDTVAMLGVRELRPVEQVAEFFAVLRLTGQRLLATSGTMLAGQIERAVLTLPAGLPETDPLRSQLVGAGEAAGFTAVELLAAPAGAVCAPGTPLRVGDLALVYDLGDTFAATLVRVGDDRSEVVGHAAVPDLPADPSAVVDLTLACSRDLLARLGLAPGQVDWVLPVGGGARTPGLAAGLEQGLGIPLAEVAEPELAVVRGAAAWLPRSGARAVRARASGQRMVPLVFTIPGGSGRLLRWLVAANQPFDEGAALARVRLPGGAVWDLTAHSRGTLDEVLVPGGREVRSGHWLALVRPQ